MTAPDYFLPAEPSVLFTSLQMPVSQEKEREALARFTSNAIRESQTFRNKGAIRGNSSSDLAEAIARENPTILNLWLPADEPLSKSESEEPRPQIFSDELLKIIPTAGRDLLILIVQNGFYWDINAQNLEYFAPFSVFTNQPVPDRLWGDFLEV